MNNQNTHNKLHVTYQGRLFNVERTLTPEAISKRILSEFNIDSGIFKVTGLMDFNNVFYSIYDLHIIEEHKLLDGVFQLCCQHKDTHLKTFKKEKITRMNTMPEHVRKPHNNKLEVVSVKQSETSHYIDFFKIAHKLDNIDNFIDKEAEAFNYKYIITLVDGPESFNVDIAVEKIFKRQKTDIFYYVCRDIAKFKKSRVISNSGFVNEFHETLLSVENQMVCMYGTKVHKVMEFLKDPISVEMTIKKLLNDDRVPELIALPNGVASNDKIAEVLAAKNSVLNALETLSNNSLMSLEDYLYIKTIVLTDSKVIADIVSKKEINNKTNFVAVLMKIKETHELKPADLNGNHLVSILADIGEKSKRYKDVIYKIKEALVNFCNKSGQHEDNSPGNNKNDMLRYLKYFFIEFMTSKIDIDMFLTNLQNDVLRMTSTPQKILGIDSGSLKDSINEFSSQKIQNSGVTHLLSKEEIETVFLQINNQFKFNEIKTLRGLIDNKDENLLNAFDLFLSDGDIQDFVETIQIILENLQGDNKKLPNNRYVGEKRETTPSSKEEIETGDVKFKQSKRKIKNDSATLKVAKINSHEEDPTSNNSLHQRIQRPESAIRDTVSGNTNSRTVISFGAKQPSSKLPNGTFCEQDNKQNMNVKSGPKNELHMSGDSDQKRKIKDDKSSNSDYGISVKTVSNDNSERDNDIELIISQKKVNNDNMSTPNINSRPVAQKTSKVIETRNEVQKPKIMNGGKPHNYLADETDLLDMEDSQGDMHFDENYQQTQENIFGLDQNEQMSPLSPMKFSIDSSLVNNSKALFSPKSRSRPTQNNILKYTNLEKNNTNRGSSFFINSKTRRQSHTQRNKHLIQLQNVNDSAMDNDASVTSGMKSQYISVFGDLSQRYYSEDDKLQLYDYLLEKIHNLSQEIYNNIVLFYKNVMPDPNVSNFESKLKLHLKRNAKNILPMFFKFKWKPVNNIGLIRELDMYLYNVDVPEYTLMDDPFGQKRKEIVEFYYNLLDFLCTPCKHLSNNQVSFFRTQLYVKDCYVLYGNLEYFLATNNVEDFVDNLFEYEKHVNYMNQNNNEVTVLDQSRFDEIESQPTHLGQIINRLTTNEERSTFLTLIKMGDQDFMGLIKDELAKNSGGNEMIIKVRKYLKAAKAKLQVMRNAAPIKDWRNGLKETFEFMPQQKMDYIKNMNYIYDILDKQVESFEADILESMYLVWEITKDKGDFLENLLIFDKMLNYRKNRDDIEKLEAIFKKHQIEQNFASLFIQSLFEDQNQHTKVASDMYKIFKITKDEKFLINSVKAMFNKKSN